MSIRRGRAHARPARRLREGETGRPLLGDQVEGRLHQSILEVAVVIAAAAASAVLRPNHVNRSYIRRGASSTAYDASLPAFPCVRMAARNGFGIGRARPPATNATRTRASINRSSPRVIR